MIFTYFCVITVIILISYHAQAQSIQPVKPQVLPEKSLLIPLASKTFIRSRLKNMHTHGLFNSMNNGLHPHDSKLIFIESKPKAFRGESTEIAMKYKLVE